MRLGAHKIRVWYHHLTSPHLARAKVCLEMSSMDLPSLWRASKPCRRATMPRKGRVPSSNLWEGQSTIKGFENGDAVITLLDNLISGYWVHFVNRYYDL